jgi:prepilin peptidase dependent protein B
MGRRFHAGLTLVELMVSLAVGLLIVAVALLTLTLHLRESQRQVTQARLAHDLQAAGELMLRDLRRAGPLTPEAQGIRFTHAGSTEELAYRLRAGVLEMKIGLGAWQAMTDVDTLRVSSLRIVPHVQQTSLAGFCSRPCPADDATCPPRQQSRQLELQIEASAPLEPQLSRRFVGIAHLAHDLLVGGCPA